MSAILIGGPPDIEAFRKYYVITVTGKHPSSVGAVTVGFVGRPEEQEDDEGVGVILQDAFDYQCDPIPVTRSDGEVVGISHEYRIKPVDGMPGARVGAVPLAMIDLDKVPHGALKRLHEHYVNAWNGAEAMKRAASGIVRPE